MLQVQMCPISPIWVGVSLSKKQKLETNEKMKGPSLELSFPSTTRPCISLMSPPRLDRLGLLHMLQTNSAWNTLISLPTL